MTEPLLPEWLAALDGQGLQRWREAQGVSRRALAKVIGCSDTTVMRYENGDLRIPADFRLALAVLTREGDTRLQRARDKARRQRKLLGAEESEALPSSAPLHEGAGASQEGAADPQRDAAAPSVPSGPPLALPVLQLRLESIEAVLSLVLPAELVGRLRTTLQGVLTPAGSTGALHPGAPPSPASTAPKAPIVSAVFTRWPPTLMPRRFTALAQRMVRGAKRVLPAGASPRGLLMAGDPASQTAPVSIALRRSPRPLPPGHHSPGALVPSSTSRRDSTSPARNPAWRNRRWVALGALAVLVVLSMLGLQWRIYRGQQRLEAKLEESRRKQDDAQRAESTAPAPEEAAEEPSMPPSKPIPEKPDDGVKRAPCRMFPRGSEVEINGGCYIKTDFKPPCPSDLYTYQDGCYVPRGAPKPKPSAKKNEAPPSGTPSLRR